MKHKLTTTISFGNKTFSHRVFYAPLAGCSDYPFRQMAAKYRPALLFCEMVKMDALVRNDPNTFHLLDYEGTMHPIGAQICGSKPEIAAQSAKIIEDLGFDVVDLNCGCPVDKVTKDGSGSGMLLTPSLIGDVLSAMVASVSIPVTVKIRAGWDEKTICAPLITQIAEQAGAKAIFVHGRTRKQAYKGPANWDYIRDCVSVAKKIAVIGNGDVVDGPSAVAMMTHTGCDGVLVSRGTMGRPWIVASILSYCQTGEQLPASHERARQELLDHYCKVLDYHRGRKAVTDARRIGCWYIKSGIHTRKFREAMSRVDSAEEALRLIQSLEEEGDSDFSDSLLLEKEEEGYAPSQL